MGHPPLEKLLPKTSWSVYKLSRLAAKRAAELASGKRPLVETDLKTKTATVALEEIAAAQVVLKDVAEQFVPVQEPEAPAPVAAEPESEEI